MSKHYKIIGRKAAEAKLADTKLIRMLVATLVHDCGMTLLEKPQIYQVEVQLDKLGKIPFEDEGGVSCIGCLSTSHIAIHTWPLRKEYHLDVYSCRDYASRFVTKRVEEVLGGELQGYDLTFACEYMPSRPSYVINYDGEERQYVCSGSNHRTYKAKSPEMSLLRARLKDHEIIPKKPVTYTVFWDKLQGEFCCTSSEPAMAAYGITPIQALKELQLQISKSQKT